MQGYQSTVACPQTALFAGLVLKLSASLLQHRLNELGQDVAVELTDW